MDGAVLANNSRIDCDFDVGLIIIVKTCLYSTSKSTMINAATFLLGGLVVLSATGPLHFALGKAARFYHQQCLDEGFEAHCAISFGSGPKYICKKLVCGRKENGVMIAIDTGKIPDEGSACRGILRPDNQLLITRICINGRCVRRPDEWDMSFTGTEDSSVPCYNRRGEIFTGGLINRAEKCHKSP